MRPTLALLAGLLVASGPAQGLALLGPLDGSTVRVQVEEGPLRVAARGNASLADHEVGPRLATLEADASTWRGLENVTSVSPSGEGVLVLADDRSAVLLPLADASNGTANASPEADGSTREREANSDRDAASGTDNRSHEPSEHAGDPEPTRSTAPSNATRQRGGTDEAPNRSEEAEPSKARTEPGTSASSGDEDALPVDPSVVVLSLLLVGALAVERFHDREGSRDPRESNRGER